MGHPMMTQKKPTPNEMVPLKFCLFIKNCMVDFGPMVKETPDTKRIFPMASSPLSKKKMIPRNEKKIPNPVKPSPIFLRSFISNETIAIASYWWRSTAQTTSSANPKQAKPIGMEIAQTTSFNWHAEEEEEEDRGDEEGEEIGEENEGKWR